MYMCARGGAWWFHASACLSVPPPQPPPPRPRWLAHPLIPRPSPSPSPLGRGPQAALLDARAVGTLARLLHKLINNSTAASTAGGPQAQAAAAAADAAEASVVAAQALEALMLLCNADISMTPAAPRETRLQVRG